MTQTEIATAIGRSQPEVSRLLHFHGTSPHARRVRAHASDIRRIVAQAGGSHVRVFGSVATVASGDFAVTVDEVTQNNAQGNAQVLSVGVAVH